MEVIFHIPGGIAAGIAAGIAEGAALSRRALETFALEEVRAGRSTSRDSAHCSVFTAWKSTTSHRVFQEYPFRLREQQ